MQGIKRTAVIVGATGGIGRAIADSLRDSHTLWLVGRDPAALGLLAKDLPDASCWPLDLSTRCEGWPPVPERLVSVDVLVHTAGSFAYGAVRDTRRDVWHHLFDVNVVGVADLTQLLLPALERARGRVVLVNSTAVTGSPAQRAIYSASKAALRTFGEALHQEEVGRGIRVTSLYLGRVATEMQRAVRDAEGGEYEPHRYLRPDAVAQAISWIVSAPDDVHVTELILRPMWTDD